MQGHPASVGIGRYFVFHLPCFQLVRYERYAYYSTHLRKLLSAVIHQMKDLAFCSVLGVVSVTVPCAIVLIHAGMYPSPAGDDK